MTASFHIGFPLFSNVTPLDLIGPQEILSRLPGAQCHLLAHDMQPVLSATGISLLPTMRYADAPQLDMVCVPGGPGHLAAMQDPVLLDFLRQQAPGCQYVTSVCTGALVLAAAGLLQGYRAATHWMSVQRLSAFGAVPTSDRVAIDRNRITGGGVTAGIDFALTVAAELHGEGVARAIQLQVQYAPQPPFQGGDPVHADENILADARKAAVRYTEMMQKVDQKVLAGMSAAPL
jgi:cyclohexyl-isocyanide hydratase